MKQRIRLEKHSKKKESLDLIARKVLMTSFLYYSLDELLVSDEQYDKWCKRLSKRWYKLDRIRQWQLGSPEEIRTTGYHVKVTHSTIGGALAWMMKKKMYKNRPVLYNKEWNYSKRYQVQYLTASDFKYQKKKRVKL